MRKLVGLLTIACGLSVALAQPPAEQPKQPTPAPAQPGTPGQPAAQPGMGQPAPDQGPKKYEIPADAKPVNRQEFEGGLIVEDFVVGTGATVLPDGVVVANYHGTLRNGGAPFDSSWEPQFQHVEPATFGLNQVIPGWTKGLPGMKVGGLRRLTIPAALAYGPQEKRDQTGKVTIPANSDLVFVVEMVATIGTEDAKVGTGQEVGKPSVAVIVHTVRTQDGKEVEKSTAEVPYIVLPGENMGFDVGLRGMKVGGKRTITVPGQLNKNAPLADIKRPSAVPLTIECELVAVRNIVQNAQPPAVHGQ